MNYEKRNCKGEKSSFFHSSFAAPRATSLSQLPTKNLFQGFANPSQFPTELLFQTMLFDFASLPIISGLPVI